MTDPQTDPADGFSAGDVPVPDDPEVIEPLPPDDGPDDAEVAVAPV